MRILVVDDAEAMRFLVSRWLGSLGHEAVAVASPADVGPRLEESEFDAVFSDVAMPDGSGWDVLALVRDRRPDLPVVIMTGWNDGAARQGPRPPDAILEKPFTIDDVRAVLDRVVRRT